MLALAPRFRESIRSSQGPRGDALRAAAAAIEAADPSVLVRNALRVSGEIVTVDGTRIDLRGFGRVIVVGGGKASGIMAAEVERLLGTRVDCGLVVVPSYQIGLPRLRRIGYARSTHPIPTEKGARATARMLEVLQGASEGDLVICLISGGGSALMPLPVEGVGVAELAETTRLLLNSGADIGEINSVRKHLSRIAGGRLIEHAGGARVLALLVSDVVSDDFSSIASGPTAPDPTSFAGAKKTLLKRGIWEAAPPAVREAITSGIEGRVKETPKPGAQLFNKVSNVLIGSNVVACSAARAALSGLGYLVPTPVTGVTGEARMIGRRLARSACSLSGGERTALVWGGETTVTVEGDGVGGRNQELALAAALELRSSSNVTLISVATDGRDGPTEAAGAIADSTTCSRAESRRLDPAAFLHDNDSYSFFRALGDLVVTGPTGTNVNDVMIALVGKS